MARKNSSNDDILRAQNESQLELIKINVEKVKKDVSDVSTFTKKEIDSVLRKVDEIILKMEKSNKAMIQGNKTAFQYMSEAQDKLSQDEIKSMKKQSDMLIKYIKLRADADREHEAKLQEQEKKMSQIAAAKLDQYQKQQEQLIQKQQQTQNAISNALKGNFTDLFNMKNNQKREDISSQMEMIKTAVGKGDMSASQGKAEMSKLMDGMKSIDASSAKMNAAATVFNTAVKVVKAFADIWIQRFFTGVDKIVDKYEEIYTAQAVQTGENQEQYFNRQREMQQSLNKQGLQNNIAMTEVMQATADFVGNGITNMAEAMRLGEQSAIAKQLAPYLNTQSDAMISLSQTFGSKFTKSIIGIAGAVSDTVGQNRFTVKNLDSIIEMLNPVMLASEKEMLGADEMAYLEYMKTLGFTDQSAMQLIHDISDIKNNPVKALEGGNLLQKIVAARGEEYVMNADILDMMNYGMSNISGILGNSSGYGRSAAINAMGMDSTLNWMMSSTKLSQLTSEGYQKAMSARDKSLSKYETLATRLADDELTTAKAQKDLLAESLAVETAILQERWPDLMNVLRNLLPGIAGLFASWIGGKLINKVGGKLLEKIGVKTTGKVAGKAATNAAGKSVAEGAAGSGGSSIAAVAVPAAGAVASGALGIYNGVQAVNDFKNGDVGYGVADTVGAVAGGVGAVTLGATAASAAGIGGAVTAGLAVPVVGWAALAVAGIIAGGVAIAKYTDYVKKSTDATEEVNAINEQRIKQMRTENKEEMKTLNAFNARIQATTDKEVAKKLVIEAGIATEEELSEAKYDNITALKKLTQQFIDSKNAMNKDAEQFLQDLNSSTGKEKINFIGEYLKKFGEDKNYKDLTNEDKKAINEYGLVMQQYIRDLVSSGDIDKDENKHAKYMYEQGILENDYTDDNLTEGDYRRLFRDGTNADRRVVGKKALSQDKYYNSLMANGEYSNKVLGYKYGYNTLMGNQESIARSLASLVAAAAEKDKDLVEQYAMEAKINGLNSLDQLNSADKAKVEAALKAVGASYAIGSPYIDSDQFAYLHEGEAVLTKAAASVLRNNTSLSISSAAGVNDALSARSSLTASALQSIANAISNQTLQLSAKIDQVIATIGTRRAVSYNQNLVDLTSSSASTE